MRKTSAFASVLFVAAGFLGATPAFAASGGYGGGTGPSDVPGGYANVVTTHSFGLIGGSLFANIPGGQAHLIVPANAFTHEVQVEVTAPDLGSVRASLPHLGFADYDVVGGIGVKAYDLNGQPVAGTFAHPLTLTLEGSAFAAGDRVIRYTGASSAVVVAADVVAGGVTISLVDDPDFAVLAPLPAVASASPSTSPPSATAPAVAAAPSAAASVQPPKPTSSATASVLGEQFTSAKATHSSAATVGWIALAIAAIAIGLVTLRNRQHDVYSGRHGHADATAGPAPAPGASAAPAVYVQRHRQQRT